MNRNEIIQVKKLLTLVMLLFMAGFVYAQGVTRQGKVASSGSDFVNSKGQRVSTGTLNVYGKILPAGFNCGADITINHLASGGVAPVDKTTTYETFSTPLFGYSKCVITKNLGASVQPATATDNTEAAAGWYWQFNRKQGFKHDGTTRTPNSSWVYPVSESSDWMQSNDPCAFELGSGWRIPTQLEWQTLDNSLNWGNYHQAFDSDFKLHAAGRLSYDYGNLASRGENMLYWSSTQYDESMAYDINGWLSNSLTISVSYKSTAFPLRCIKDCTPPTAPTGREVQAFYYDQTVSDLKVTGTAIKWYAELHGGSVLPDDTKLVDGNHYYASQTVGDCESTDRLDVTAQLFHCGNFLAVIHSASNGVAPVNKDISYRTRKTTLFGGNKCIIAQNLGAHQQATAPMDDDEAAAGWYWQFNRQQGYSHDGAIRIPNSTWNTSSDNESSTWETAKDPCALEMGEGWRILTYEEWTEADAGWTNAAQVYNSGLKLHMAGWLNAADGNLNQRGSQGNVWSSDESNTANGWSLDFTETSSQMSANQKANAYPVRCIRDCTPAPAPTGEPVQRFYAGQTLASLSVTGTSITWYDEAEGGNVLPTTTILADSVHYFATQTVNDCESVERLDVFAIQYACSGPAFVVSHLVAEGVAPVDKTVTYGTASTNLFGGYKCAITQNLGASNQATSATDATEASAGWYWQFNRKQGYKHDGTTRTPNTTWVTSIEEESDWLPENDPCALELGAGWRIPTQSEWYNARSTGGWNNVNDTYASVLKLHAAGGISYLGNLDYRGNMGKIWSITSSELNLAYRLEFNANFAEAYSHSFKSSGFSVRCIKD